MSGGSPSLRLVAAGIRDPTGRLVMLPEVEEHAVVTGSSRCLLGPADHPVEKMSRLTVPGDGPELSWPQAKLVCLVVGSARCRVGRQSTKGIGP